MTYLDREPRVGDRVQSQITGVVTDVSGGSVSMTGDDGYPRSYALGSVRVIAPDPRVGDVVTADMDLPPDSIIEQPGMPGRIAQRTRSEDGQRYFYDNDAFSFTHLDSLSTVAPWRVVRIGPAQ